MESNKNLLFSQLSNLARPAQHVESRGCPVSWPGPKYRINIPNVLEPIILNLETGIEDLLTVLRAGHSGFFRGFIFFSLPGNGPEFRCWNHKCLSRIKQSVVKSPKREITR